MPDRSDQDWVHLLKQEDPQAWQEIWEKLFGWCFVLAQRKGQDEHFAQDVGEEAYWRIKRNLAQYSFRGSFPGWCRQIATNEVYRLLSRRLAERQHMVGLDDPLLKKIGEADPDPQIDPKILLERLRPCLEQLTSNRHKVVELIYFQQLSPQVAADQLGESRNNVNKLAFDARKALKDCLKRHGYQSVEDVMYTES